MYYDEVELCNPIGSKRKIHKIGKCVKTCKYMCAHVWHTHVHIHVYMSTLTYIYVHVHVYTCFSIYLYMYTCSYVVMHVYICIGVFYFTMGNVNPKHRSKLKSIQLAALVKPTHLVKYGMNVVLRPIVDDLKKLVSCTCLTKFIFTYMYYMFHETVFPIYSFYYYNCFLHILLGSWLQL